MFRMAKFVENIFITFSHICVTQSLISETIIAVVNCPYNQALKQFIEWSLWGHIDVKKLQMRET